MTFAERLGRNLTRFREEGGISQEELGHRAGLHRTAISQLERGTRVARCDTLVKLAGALGIRPEELLEGLSWTPAVVTGGELLVASDHEAIRS